MGKRRNIDIILVIYGVTLMSMLLFLYKSSAVLNYVRYLYTLFMIIVTIAQGYIYKNIKIFNILGLFLLHTILFGFILVPSTAMDSAVFDNVKEIAVFWLFVFTTAQYIHRKQLIKEFILISQFCVSLFMDFCYFRHFNGIAPLKFISGIFGTDGRVRFSFGLSASNRAAYLAVASIILIYIVLKEKIWVQMKIGKVFDFYRLFLIGSLFVGVLVLLSTQTRGGILAVFVFLLINNFVNSKKIRKYVGSQIKNKIFIISYIMIIACFAGYLYYVIQISASRSAYLGIALNVYKKLANKWVGLGYVPFSSFLSNTMGWGTTALDCYYVYIICSTGIGGAIIIFGALIYTLNQFMKSYFDGETDMIGNATIAIYITLLIIGFSETMVVAPWVPHNYIFWILFLLVLLNAKENRKKITKQNEDYLV